MERLAQADSQETEKGQIACTQIPPLYSLFIPQCEKSHKLLQIVIPITSTKEFKLFTQCVVSPLPSVHFPSTVHDLYK